MRFYGNVGFGTQEQTESGSDIWEDVITERPYYGDVLKNAYRWDASNSVNDDFKVNNRISIMADTHASTYFNHIRYVEWKSSKWNVIRVEEEYPRLILTLGGVYNGPTPSET